MIKKEQIKITLNLTLVAALCTLLISMVMHLTKEAVSENVLKERLSLIVTMMNKQEFEVLPLPQTTGFDAFMQEDKPYYLSKNHQLIVLPWKAPNAYQDEILFFITINRDGIIKQVRVSKHKETPGLGDKIERAKSDWILSFNSKKLSSPKDFQVKKYGGQFDSFSGATITPQAMVKSVYQALVYVNQYHKLLFIEADNGEEVK